MSNIALSERMRLACLSVFLYLRAEPTALRLSVSERKRLACGLPAVGAAVWVRDRPRLRSFRRNERYPPFTSVAYLRLTSHPQARRLRPHRCLSVQPFHLPIFNFHLSLFNFPRTTTSGNPCIMDYRLFCLRKFVRYMYENRYECEILTA